MSQAAKIHSHVEHFLAKTLRINQPLQTFMHEAEFERFRELMRSGIEQQIRWLAEELPNLPEQYISDDFEPITDAQEARLNNFIYSFMPKLVEYVSEQEVFTILEEAFVWGVAAQYRRYGWVFKPADSVSKIDSPVIIDFSLTNPEYIAALKNQANYLLNKSSLDKTTRQALINFIRDGKLASLTTDELAASLLNNIDALTESRAYTIARTETAQAMSSGQHAAMKRNGVATKSWIPAGASTCPVCDGNAEDGFIGIDEIFSGGAYQPPQHPNCECYLEGGEIDLEAIDIWGGQ